MLQASDLIRLKYTSDLTEAGIAYACQHIANFVGNEIEAVYVALQQLVINKAVELAFRRYLSNQGVESKTVASLSANNQDPFHLLIGKWHCIFQSYWVDSPQIVQQVQDQPECLLQAAAWMPAERVIAWIPGERDIYIFGYVTGQVAEPHEETGQSLPRQRSMHWISLLPSIWSQPTSGRIFGRLEFNNQSSEALQLTLGGRSNSLTPLREQHVLGPGEHALSHQDYATLEYLHTPQLPVGQIGIFSPAQRRSYVIHPSAWKNFNLHGTAIYLAGYISIPEYARRSRRLAPGRQIFPGFQARGKARILYASELNPMREILEPSRPGCA